MDSLLRAGADKVAVNTAAISRPELLAGVGSAIRIPVHRVVGRRPHGACRIVSHSVGLGGDYHGGRQGQVSTRSNGPSGGAELGVGEILLNSMDADGTKTGFDLKMLAAAGRL